jgi:hypothetical protein
MMRERHWHRGLDLSDRESDGFGRALHIEGGPQDLGTKATRLVPGAEVMRDPAGDFIIKALKPKGAHPMAIAHKVGLGANV